VTEPDERQDLLLTDTAAEIEAVFDLPQLPVVLKEEIDAPPRKPARRGLFASLSRFFRRPFRKVRDRRGEPDELGEAT
jgi:hypothetical protein